MTWYRSAAPALLHNLGDLVAHDRRPRDTAVDLIQTAPQPLGDILHSPPLIVTHPRQPLAGQPGINVALRRHIAAHHNQLLTQQREKSARRHLLIEQVVFQVDNAIAVVR